MGFSSSGSLLIAATASGIFFAWLGIFLSTRRIAVRLTIPLAGGLLLGVALFGLLPELAHDTSWFRSAIAFGAGFGLLTVLDRLGVQVCPDCAHEHEHHTCGSPLHGFAIPLLLAGAVHSLFDGWALVATHDVSSTAVRVGLPLALVLHKVPEGLALGGLMRAAVRSRWIAFTFAATVEAMTLAGGYLGGYFEAKPGSAWSQYPLGVAGGCFVYLGAHALHGEWKRQRRARVLA